MTIVKWFTNEPIEWEKRNRWIGRTTAAIIQTIPRGQFEVHRPAGRRPTIHVSPAAMFPTIETVVTNALWLKHLERAPSLGHFAEIVNNYLYNKPKPRR